MVALMPFSPVPLRKRKWLILALLFLVVGGIALLVRENSRFVSADAPAGAAAAFVANGAPPPPSNATAFAAQALARSGIGNASSRGPGRSHRRKHGTGEGANGTPASAPFAAPTTPAETSGTPGSATFALADNTTPPAPGGNGGTSNTGGGNVPAFLPLNAPGSGGVAVNVAPTSTPTTPGGVPEPETWAMMGLGFAIVGAFARRRNKAARKLGRTQQV